MVPVATLNVGETVIVTACPVLVAEAAPVITIVPLSATDAVAIFPTTGIVTPPPAQAVLLGSVWNFSEIPVRAPDAANINSDTFARTV